MNPYEASSPDQPPAAEESASQNRSTLIGLACMGLGLFAWLVWSEISYHQWISPTGIATASDYVARYGEPDDAWIVTSGGKDYYELRGKLPGLPSIVVASDRAAYVFDSQGRLVDWCRDPGDLPHRPKWPYKTGTPLPFAQVRQALGV